MLLVTSIYPLTRAIPAIIASLESISVPLRRSSERSSLDLFKLSKLNSRTFIELNSHQLAYYLLPSD